MQAVLMLIGLSLVGACIGAEPDFSWGNIKIRSGFGNLLSRGEKGESIRVGFLGGSITQNPKGHSGLVPGLLKQRFPKSAISSLNAGLSSTCSTSGAFRLGSQVLDKGPLDLLVVEFAVNDDQDAGHSYRECLRGMEGIVRQVLVRSPATEMIIVYFLNEGMMADLQHGKTPIPMRAHETVANHYGITSVSVATEVAGAIKQGVYTWKDYGGVHPKSFGYQIASKMIVGAITGGGERSDRSRNSQRLPKPIDAFSYDAARFVGVDKAITNGNWSRGKVGRESIPTGSIRSQYQGYQLLRGNRPGDSLKLRFSGTAAGAFILAGPDSGMVRTRVDGGDWQEHDLFHRFSEKLNYPRSVIFAAGLERGKHQLELEIADVANTKSSGNAVNLLFFEVN